MDYKEKYEKALERAKGAHDSAKADIEKGVEDKITQYTTQLTETIFPELKESDDERIRKWIINEIKIKHHNLDEENVDFVDKAIAWLEKQGEQKSAWSEEDEGILHCLEYTVKHYYDDKNTIDKCCSWLTSLKERMKGE